MSEWKELTDLVGDRPFTVSEVRLGDQGISVRGDFDLPPLAGLRFEDQVFVSEFVRCHGSIKYMEKAFGISYPTVKNRLNRIVQQLHLGEVEQVSDRDEVFDLLERGQITVQEATERLRRSPRSDASPPEGAGYAREKDAGSANSSAIGATEDTLSGRPVHSGGRGVALRRPTEK